MFIKLVVILLLMRFNCLRSERLDWELAVVVENEINLYQRNGTLIESKTQPFSSLKALAYDNVRDQFIVSDMDKVIDTIYTVQMNKETDITEPIIKGLPGDVQGLAIDPLEDILYWTDAINHTINYVSLKETPLESKEFLSFDETLPHALAIDACNRYLYFTNPGDKPSIERIKLDKTQRETLVDNLIMSPVGLAIDNQAQKLYWADSRIGTVSGRIESIKLDGTNRNIVLERNTMEPFGLAVDEEAIYFTDTNNNGLYMFPKVQDPYDDPIKLLGFSNKPMGLVANNNFIKESSDCKSLDIAIKEYKEPTPKEDLTSEKETQIIKECLNGGELTANYCLCKRGFTGRRCETSICSSYFCLNGDCYLSSGGKPLCHCERGFVGERCQKNSCEGFCLNGGECSVNSSIRNAPTCTCSEGYVGDRCEYDIQICDNFCQNRKNELFSEKYTLLCR
nr:protein cueball-like [Leptinotarsa decemlineata]